MMTILLIKKAQSYIAANTVSAVATKALWLIGDITIAVTVFNSLVKLGLYFTS